MAGSFDPLQALQRGESGKGRQLFRADLVSETAVLFVSQAAVDADIRSYYGLQKQTLPVQNCRNIGKKDLIHNKGTPEITVDPERYEVRVDGEHITCAPAEKVPLAQRYFLF